jgi:hypothetical protein
MRTSRQKPGVSVHRDRRKVGSPRLTPVRQVWFCEIGGACMMALMPPEYSLRRESLSFAKESQLLRNVWKTQYLSI